nr:MAG TPA: hypothetical protein [Caudoviricetes sp.]
MRNHYYANVFFANSATIISMVTQTQAKPNCSWK